jgi:hypothetical protein
MKAILDRFTKLGVSRQRKYQMRHDRAGLCNLCPRPAVMAFHCLEHAVRNREDQRVRQKSGRRNFGSKTYRLEGGGGD